MPIGKIRESITPLDNSKTFSVKIQQNESKIKKITYELRDIANQKVLETNSYMSFDSDGKYLTSKITLNQALDTSTEYDMQITLTTNVSKKIHFYTRIKYYTSDFFLQQKLDFVSSFHNATLDPQSGFNISSYLEATTNEDATLANVDIHSSKKMNPVEQPKTNESLQRSYQQSKRSISKQLPFIRTILYRSVPVIIPKHIM